MLSEDLTPARDFRAIEIDGDMAQAMLRQSPDCVMLLDRSGRLHYMNDNGLLRMEIADFHELQGKLWWTLWPEPIQQTLRNAVDAANRGLSTCFEAGCPTALGAPRHWRVRVSRIGDGALSGMLLVVSQDITEKLISERRQDRLQAENDALRRFTHLVSHELGSPIRHLCLLAEMAQRDSASAEDSTSLIGRIGSVSADLLSLLKGLEALNALSPPAQGLRFDVAEVTARAQRLVGPERVELSLQVAPGCESLPGDQDQFTAVFRNLLENAVKFRDRERPARVAIDVQQVENTVSVTISDDGPGFPLDQRDQALQPLVRLGNAEGLPGVGLGLALVDRVVQSTGGYVCVAPEPTTPAAVVLCLPRVGGLP